MRFKDLRSQLKEHWDTPGTARFGHLNPAVGPMNPDGAVDTPEISIAQLTGESLNRLNAFLGASFNRSYIAPSNVLNQIRIKLGEVGLMFEYRMPPAKTGANNTTTITNTTDKRGPIDEIGEGVYEFPLVYLGGSYGRYPTDPGYEPYRSDNISNKVGTSLVLCVEISRNPNNTYQVNPTITQKSV